MYALVHPMAKNLGNCRVRIKVLLELQPPVPPPERLLKSSVWEVIGSYAALTSPTPEQPETTLTEVMTSSVAAISPTAEQSLAVVDSIDHEEATSKQATPDHQTGAAVLADHGNSAVISLLQEEPQATLDDESFPVTAAPSEGEVQQQVDRLAIVEAHAAAADLLQPDVTPSQVSAPSLTTHIHDEPGDASQDIPVLSAESQPPAVFQQPAAVEPDINLTSTGRRRAEVTHARAPNAAMHHSPSAAKQYKDVRVCMESALNLNLPPCPDGKSLGCCPVSEHACAVPCSLTAHCVLL